MKHHLIRTLCGGALLAVFLLPDAVAGATSLTPRQWLERMSQAAHELNYDGVFVYSHDGHMQSMRIIHSSSNGKERERLLSLSGPPREVIRDNEKVTCILPDDADVVVERSGPARLLPADLAERLETLEQYYSFRDGGDERIAGHPARKIVIAPRDHYRYGHALWLHHDTGLLLRSELYNEEGRIVEQLMFTSLQFHDSLAAALLEPETEGRDVVWQRDVERTAADGLPERWTVGELPPGFLLENHRHHFMAGATAPVEHLLFSDGFASVSVFIEAEEEGRDSFLGGSRLGAVNAYSRSHESHYITVVGEVPPVTARRIAESVTLRR